MDKGLMIKELAQLIGVAEDTLINREIKGTEPQDGSLKKLKEVLRVF